MIGVVTVGEGLWWAAGTASWGGGDGILVIKKMNTRK